MKKLHARLGCIGIGIVLLAALLRLLLLEMKPPHFDEGVNGFFVDQMTRIGYFAYDPANYHGPLHFYLLFLAQTLFGRHIEALRFPVALFSVASVALVLLFDRFFNRRICRFAALSLAVSPAAIFYGRYAIHESELVFFMILALWGALGIWRSGSRRDLWALGLGITGMWLTKETFVIHIICFALAIFCAWIWRKIFPCEAESRCVRFRFANRDLWSMIAVCVVLILFFYSGNFLDFPALKGIYLTYDDWIRTGNGSDQAKPFYYWLELIALYEWPALIGLAGVFWLMFSKSRSQFLRLIAIYACGALAAYSIINYKTPWCIISVLWPFYFLFGAVTDRILETRFRMAGFAVSGLLLASSLGFSIWLNFFHYDDVRVANTEVEKFNTATDLNWPLDYVYVQTLDDVYKLVDPLEKLAHGNPTFYHISGNVLLESYHPLPWMLGDFTNIGYYENDSNPTDFGQSYDAGFLLVGASRIAEVDHHLRHRYFTEMMTLRSGEEPAKLYFRYKVFHKIFVNRHPHHQSVFLPQ